MNTSWNIGSIGMAGPPLRGPSSPRLLAEPPLSPPVSSTSTPTASAQPLEPAAPLGAQLSTGVASAPHEPLAAPTADPTPRPATSLESLLMRFRLITSEQLDQALREKLETGKDVGAIVVERGWVNEDQLARLLAYAPALAAPAQTAPAVSTDVQVAPPAETRADTPSTDRDVAAQPAAPVAIEPVAEPVAQPVETPVEAPVEAPAPASHEIPPALELVEPIGEPEPEAVPAEPETAVEAVTPVAATPAPWEPTAPAAEEPSRDTEPAAHAAAVAQPVAVPTVEQADAARAPETVSVASFAPATDAAPLPDSAPLQAEAAPTREAEPVHEREPAAAPVAASADSQVVRFVEPAPIETIARVFVRLSNGERVEAGSFDDVAAAKARAEDVVRHVSAEGNGWPFFGGRYIRPDVVVSVDVDATVVRYA